MARTLTRVEEVVLWERAQTNERAREEFFEANLALVWDLANKFPSDMRVDDLASAGYVGLIHAFKMFDPSKGYKFSTYAIQWIRRAFHRASADEEFPLRLPAHAREVLIAGRQLRSRAASEGKELSTEEVAQKLGATVDMLISAQCAACSMESFDAPIGSDQFGSVHDVFADPTAYDPETIITHRMNLEHMRARLEAALRQYPLPERSIQVLLRRADGETLDQIGKTYCITRERVRQLEYSALRTIKFHQNKERLENENPNDETHEQEALRSEALQDALEGEVWHRNKPRTTKGNRA